MTIDVSEITTIFNDASLDDAAKSVTLRTWINEKLLDNSESHADDLQMVSQYIHDSYSHLHTEANEAEKNTQKANLSHLVDAIVQQYLIKEKYTELKDWYLAPDNANLLKHFSLNHCLDRGNFNQEVKVKKVAKFTETILQSFFEPTPNPQKLTEWLLASEHNYQLAQSFIRTAEDTALKTFVTEPYSRAKVLRELGTIKTDETKLFDWLIVPANKVTAEVVNISQYLNTLNTAESKATAKIYNQVANVINDIETLKYNTLNPDVFLPLLPSSLKQAQAPEIFKVLNGVSKMRDVFNHVLCREYLNFIFSEDDRWRITNKEQLKEQQAIALQRFITHIENPAIGIKDADIACLAQYCDYVSKNEDEPLSQDVLNFYVKYLNSDKITDQQLRVIRDNMLQLFKSRPDIIELHAITEPLIKKISAQGVMKNDSETDELLSLHLKTLKSPSDAALLLITEKLKQNEPHETLRFNYSNIISVNPKNIAEKLILNLETFSNLSEQIQRGKSEYSRETRAAAAIKGVPDAKIKDVAELLAYELIINTGEKSAVHKANILEMLDQNYEGTEKFKEALRIEINKLLDKPDTVALKDSKQALLKPSQALIANAWLAKGKALLAKPLKELDDNALFSIIECLEKAKNSADLLSFTQWKKVFNLLEECNLTESQANNIWEFLERNAQAKGMSEVATQAFLSEFTLYTKKDEKNIEPDMLSGPPHESF